MSILAIRPNVSNRTVFTSLDRATQAFRAVLDRLGYSAVGCREACFAIREYQETASLVALGLIDAEDEPELEAAFANGFDDVHPASPQWAADPSTWTASVPDIREALEYALMTGEFDPLDAPLPDAPDAEQPDEDWLSAAQWSSSLDPTDRYLECELTEVGISRR